MGAAPSREPERSEGGRFEMTALGRSERHTGWELRLKVQKSHRLPWRRGDALDLLFRH